MAPLDPPAAGHAAATSRSVKRAMAQLRKASAGLAQALERDVVAEVHVGQGADDGDVLEALALARARGYGDLDVVILAAPRQ